MQTRKWPFGSPTRMTRSERALRERLGIQSAADIFPLALRCLVKKEGVEPSPAGT